MAVEIATHADGINVEHLNFSYPDGGTILNDISFSIPAGARVLLAGATGSGKSTLLRCLKQELTPAGDYSGSVIIDGVNVRKLNAQQSAGRIGFVMQDPHQQIVMDTVKAELAFGLENLGTPQELIQRRVAEISNYFGINSWVDRNITELSGGEMQLVNLASVIAMQPRTLLLDEPTAALDPIAAREFIELVLRVNEELGITILVVEHNQEDLLTNMNQVLYLEDGKLAFDGRSREFATWLYTSGNTNKGALPVATKLYLNQPLNKEPRAADVPLDVKEGRSWLWHDVKETIYLGAGHEAVRIERKSHVELDTGISSNNAETRAHSTPAQRTTTAGEDTAQSKVSAGATVLEAKHVWYRYRKEDPYVLKDLSLKIPQGHIFGLVGANASGKSTLLSLLSGTAKPQHGKVLQAAGLQYGMLPQDPTTLFIRDTVLEDLMDHAKDYAYTETEVDELLEVTGLLDKKRQHPFDLSGGEQQKLGICKLLLSNPDVILMDEPTTGLDSQALADLTRLLRAACDKGKTIVMVSHDLEFVAATADECLMMFDGAPIGRAPVKEFFTGNMFYTTALRRITQGILEDCPPVLGWGL